MNAPPLSQTQVQFPIIDELADDFAILIAGVNRKVHSLSASRLQGLKALFEEKLKSKGVPITIPSSVDELISTISQYWDFLNIEFAQLVVRYLGKKDLQTQMKRYEEKLQKKAKILLTQCREKNVTPRAPPGCFNMKITVDEDPYSFSLHRILEFKNFLVHRIGMDIALFTGFRQSSIILHFCILEDDMETAVCQLYAHKLELRAMQVVVIEVGDVIVYRDTPIKRPPSIAAVSSNIDDLAVAMKIGGPIVSKVCLVTETKLQMEEAIRSGNLGRIQELIQGGADVNAFCRKGMPLLSRSIKEGYNEIALKLIDHGANVHATDGQGRTALHWACREGGREVVVQRLIEEGCSVNAEDAMHCTALSLTTEWCGVAAASHLFNAGADCRGLSKRQMNVLFLPACWRGYLSVAEKLLANGCDINCRNNADEPPIILAVNCNHYNVVKMLIRRGAQLDLQDHDGATALHCAARNNHIECGVLLTEGGAKVNIKDKHSRTALDVAYSEDFRQAINHACYFKIRRILTIVGNTGVGKSTLVATLQAEKITFFGKIRNRFTRVSDNRNQTAGIEPIHYPSQRYGDALFFDFAGQHEYHGPHQMFLESFLSKRGVCITLMMVVKVTDEEDKIMDQLHQWLDPVAQMAATAEEHPEVIAIVIGSFLDRERSKADAAAKLSRCIKATKDSLVDSPMQLVGPCLLNCRKPQSEGIDQLCHILQEIPIPELKAIHTEYSLAWVLSQVKLTKILRQAVKLAEFADWIEANKDNLPLNIPSPEQVCKDLSAAGHALYLPMKDKDSWLVLDLGSILQDVYGTLFSQSKDTMNEFGLLHCQELAELLPKLAPEMVQQLLISLEFCTPVELTARDVEHLTGSKEDSGWLFFPALVSAEPPKVKSDGHSQQSIHSLWWQLRTSARHFFFARFLQTILLHVAANFVVKHDIAEGQMHCCSFWRNGISWQSNDGVDVTVHITERVLHVVGTGKETADRLYQCLMKVIDHILSTIHQVSPNLKADAYIVHRAEREGLPCEVFELPPPSPKELFPVSSIVRSIKEAKRYALSQLDEKDISQTKLVSDLFAGHTPTQEDVERILWPQPSLMQCQSPTSTAEMLQPLPTPTVEPRPLPTPTAEPPQPLPTPTVEPRPLPTPTAEPTQPLPTPTAEPPQPLPTPTAEPPQPLPTPTAEPLQPLATPTAKPLQPLPTPTAEPLQPLATPTAKPLQPLPTPTAKPPQALPTPTAESQTLLDVLSTPTSEDISKLVVTEVAFKWKSVATLLCVRDCVINNIAKNHPTDCEEACLGMLNRWLSREHYTGEKERTWSTLLTALKEAGLVAFNERLLREHFKAVAPLEDDKAR